MCMYHLKHSTTLLQRRSECEEMLFTYVCAYIVCKYIRTYVRSIQYLHLRRDTQVIGPV